MDNKSEKEHRKKGIFVNKHTSPEGHHSKTTESYDTDKYLALEQPGVSYTKDIPPLNSDKSDFGVHTHDEQWSEEGGNSKNSDAFNQDDYLLDDNIDLDEDQNKSISSDDEDFEETNERY